MDVDDAHCHFEFMSKMGTCLSCGKRFKDLKRHYDLSKSCLSRDYKDISSAERVVHSSEVNKDQDTHYLPEEVNPEGDCASVPPLPPEHALGKWDLTDIELAVAQYKYNHNLSNTAANDLCELITKVVSITKIAASSSLAGVSFKRKTFSGIEKKIDHLQKRKLVLESGDYLEEAFIPVTPEISAHHPEIETLYIAYNDPKRYVQDISKKFKPEQFLEILWSGGKESVDDFDSGECWKELQDDVTKRHGPGVKMLPLAWFRDGAAASRGTRSVTPITVIVAGLTRDVRNTVEAKHLAGYESIYASISHSDALRAAKDAIFNFFMSLLDELESTPFVLDFGCPYAPVTVCVRHLLFLGDHPEANPEAGVSGSVNSAYPCRDCEVKNEDIYKTSFFDGCSPVFRDWESIDCMRWDVKLKTPAATASLKYLEEKNIFPNFAGSHAAYGCKSAADVDCMKHLGTKPNLRIPYELLHAWLLGLPKRLCLLVVKLIQQAEPNRVRAEKLTIEYCLGELDRRVQMFKASKLKKGRYTPTFTQFNSKAGLRAEDYRYLSQMLIFIIGSGDCDFFKKDTTILLRWVLLRAYDIGKEMFAEGRRWTLARRLAFRELLKDFGDNFYNLFRGISKCRYIKNHLLLHLDRDFDRFGSPLNYIVHSYERCMVEFVRTVFARTNGEKSPKTEKRMLLEIIRRLMINDEVHDREQCSVAHVLTGEKEEHDDEMSTIKENNSYPLQDKLISLQATFVMTGIQHQTGMGLWDLQKDDDKAQPYFTLCPNILDASDGRSQVAIVRRIGRIVERSFSFNSHLMIKSQTGSMISFWDKLIANQSSWDKIIPPTLQMYKGVELGGFQYICDGMYRFNNRGVQGPRYDFIRVKPTELQTDPSESWIAQLLAVFIPTSAGTGKAELGTFCLVRWLVEVERNNSRVVEAPGGTKRKRAASPPPRPKKQAISENKYSKRIGIAAAAVSKTNVERKNTEPQPKQLERPTPAPVVDYGCHSRFRHFGFELERDTASSKVLSFKYDCVLLSDVHRGISPVILYDDLSYNKGKPLKDHRYYEVLYY